MTDAAATSGGPGRLSGRCLCGAVRFTIEPPFRPVIVCHCRQCARWTGYAVAATAVTPEHFHVIASADSLAWYRASEHASRGFCRACGSSLFWKPDDGSRISVLAGSLDPPTGLTVAAHIYVADKSDYVAIAEGAPCYEHESTAPLLPPARIGKT